MGHSQISGDEIEQRGVDRYRQIRHIVETEENIGRICAINVETGEYFIADEILAAAAPLRAKYPGVVLWGERIGYNAMYALSGFADIERTAK